MGKYNKDYHKKYYQKNKRKILERTREYNAKNKEERNRKGREYYYKHRTECLKNSKVYRNKNKDYFLKKNKEYYKKHPIRKYVRNVTRRDYDKIKCESCHGTKDLEFHHFIYRLPVRREDFTVLCRTCHDIKHRKGISEVKG